MDFSVGDDYELIVRSFLEAGFCRIVACGCPALVFDSQNRYTQYRNVGYFNHTNMRNALIQRMTLHASHQFTPLLIKHFEERGFFVVVFAT